MEEIVKHINDTNASYRTIGAGDAKNTDLFLDNEHFEFFKDCGEQIKVRLHKENLQKAILFIASILPRKYDNSSTHKTIHFSTMFVYEQMALLDAFFTIDGEKVNDRMQVWNARKGVEKKNGEIDNRFYFNGLLEDVVYKTSDGESVKTKFTIRNYLAGGYSNLYIIKSEDDGVFDIFVKNVLEPYDDGKDKWVDEIKTKSKTPLQIIYYGTPGSGKSHKVKEMVEGVDENFVFRTTFHPDSDYASFVGCYKPVMEGDVIKYKFTPQAFTKAYVTAWKNQEQAVYLVIEEINRGNCAQIFGDLFQLLDRKDGVSEYPIDADNDLKDYLEKELGVGHDGIANGKLRLPSNLNILATMNTSDQSLFPMDSAFKRRWDWECVPVDYKNVDSAKFVINIDGKDYLWHDFLENVNARIKKATDSEDKQMGNFFITGNVTENQFVNKVMFYLWNDICKEEFGSLNNFFRNYIDEKKSETEEFSFNDLFTSDKKKLLSKFMEYIEVKSVADVKPEKSEEESE